MKMWLSYVLMSFKNDLWKWEWDTIYEIYDE
jgi:hypothetical protein